MIRRAWPAPPGAVFIHSLPQNAKGKRIWRCSVCGKRSTWGESWQCWCSELQLDEGYVEAVTCSEKCRERLALD